ncbi:MAG: hypothetical protein KDB68_14685 [Planctomycetes bacterium]|nr:hypothetical protein [Planctomycetota bacterium]
MGALNLAGDMAGVNGVLSGALRQDLYSGQGRYQRRKPRPGRQESSVQAVWVAIQFV